MLVDLVVEGDVVAVSPVAMGGAVSGGGAIVRPGESWRGWKHRRLHRLGTGRHELLRKDDPVHEDADSAGVFRARGSGAHTKGGMA